MAVRARHPARTFGSNEKREEDVVGDVLGEDSGVET